jgi:spore germination protein KA
MIVVFEILRETGLRMPASIGQTLGVAGAIVIGTSVVEAKIISAPIIIIVALAGITGLMIPRLKGAVILLRLVFLIACSIIGLYGYIFIVIGLLIHLLNLRSFGVPYMSTFSPNNLQDVKDTVIRAPWWDMLTRPKFIAKDKIRNKPGGDV